MKDPIQVRVLRKHDLYYVQYRTRWFWSYSYVSVGDGGVCLVKYSTTSFGAAHEHAVRILDWMRRDLARSKAQTSIVEVLP